MRSPFERQLSTDKYPSSSINVDVFGLSCPRQILSISTIEILRMYVDAPPFCSTGSTFQRALGLQTTWLQDVPLRPTPIPCDSKIVDDFPTMFQRVLHAVNVRPALSNLLKTDVCVHIMICSSFRHVTRYHL